MKMAAKEKTARNLNPNSVPLYLSVRLNTAVRAQPAIRARAEARVQVAARFSPSSDQSYNGPHWQPTRWADS